MIADKKRKSNVLALFPAAKKSRQMGFLPVSRPKRPQSGKFEGLRAGVATSGSSAPELKIWDLNVGQTDVLTGTPYVASLTSGIAEGTTGATRVGQKILLKSVDVKFDVRASVGSTVTYSSTTPDAFVDVMAVWDKSPDGTIATAANIFQVPGTNVSMLNTINLERFVVLRRESIGLSVSNSARPVSWHIPLSLATRFTDATNVAQTNDVYICALSPNVVAGATAGLNPQISYYARTKFTDA